MEPFTVLTLEDYSVVARRVFTNCLIFLHNRVTFVDLVELDMVDFDANFGIDCFPSWFPSLDC